MQRELAEQGIRFGSDEVRESRARFERPPITTEVDVAPYVERKRSAMRQHRSQFPPDMPFDKLSEELQRRFFTVEYLHRADPPWNEGEPTERWIVDE
jgi:LmbE family N-acetylglucosaminyl deacetylase